MENQRKIVYDRKLVEAEAQRLKKLGYPDDLIELREIDGIMHARPLGSKPTLEERIADIFPNRD